MMGRNLDLIGMCGLPTEIEYKGKKYDIEGQLRDYDIDDDGVNPQDGVWCLSLGFEDDAGEEVCLEVTFKCASTVIKIKEDN